MKHIKLAILLPLSLSLSLGMPVLAAGSNCSNKDIACVSGGVGSTEREELQQQAGQYTLWLRTAASKSGAYLADIKVVVRDEKTKAVLLTTTLDGPWLFLALPDGRYEIEAHYHDKATRSDQIVKKISDIKKAGQRQMMMYFDASNVGELIYKPAS
ncbi:hypothetical protein [Undibacterium umbellatum]|uniref:Carboxypeptidase regulatory-like domain-containing protein n=1 Tax=Undibacterium umbellatum TaxID=2762300 RepID=A0ABR6ZAY7_9BURK|nr:hypothetical protein [Undibacterium umbellatum]MBC3908914.1 hypothetical protein [Undibacterium umbellatum]